MPAHVKSPPFPSSEKVVLARIRRWLPPEVKRALQTLDENGAQAFLVGGGVRDAFLSRKPGDWDIATAAKPEEVAGFFARVNRAGEKHGTIMVLPKVKGESPVEITTFRSEGPYSDGRRPEHVSFHRDIHADLARRDFTINAMAADLNGAAIIDPFGGADDLRAGLVRCVGVAAERFNEDGLRLLRALRFAAILAFRLHRDTRAALKPSLPTFEKVAWERKRDEMLKLLARGRRFKVTLSDLHTSGVLEVLAGELRASGRAAAAMQNLPDDEPWLRLAAWAYSSGVSADGGFDLVMRWRGSKRDAEQFRAWLRGLDLLPAKGASAAEIRRWIARVGIDESKKAALLAAAVNGRVHAHLPHQVRAQLNRYHCFSLGDLALDGTDLLAAGYQGKAVGQVLDQLWTWVLAQPQRNRRPELLAHAHTLSTGKKQG